MAFHFLSRSSCPARNIMNRWRNCKSLPANRPWLIIQENAAKSHHTQLSSAPNPYSSYATLSRFFSAQSLKKSDSAPLYKETTTTGDRKGKKSDHSNKRNDIKWFLAYALTSFGFTYKHNLTCGGLERVKPVRFEDLSKLLDAGKVDHILVTGSLAIVYTMRSVSDPVLEAFFPIALYAPREFPPIIYIESPESFAEKLERAQAALGIMRVPVTYIDTVNGESEF